MKPTCLHVYIIDIEIMGLDLVSLIKSLHLPSLPSSSQRAYTYPAPSLQYSRPPTAPHYLPPPSTGPLSSATTSTTPVSENTKKAIETIHSLLARSTTYREHFTPRSYPTQIKPCSRPDHSISSRLSVRPWTAESRGKYSHYTPDDTFYYPYLEYAHTEHEESRYDSKAAPDSEQGKRECNPIPEEEGDDVQEEKDSLKIEEEDDDDVQDIETSDAETQTEEGYFKQHEEDVIYPSSSQPEQITHGVLDYSTQTPDTTLAPPRKPIDALTAKLYRLPLIDTPPVLGSKDQRSTPIRASTSPAKSLGIHLSKRVGTLEPSSYSTKKQISSTGMPQQSVSQKLHTLSKVTQDDSRLGKSRGLVLKPRSMESTRRMLQVFNGYSKSKVLNRFNQQYQESAPDLRKFSTREGKRHFIHGTHAYYYH